MSDDLDLISRQAAIEAYLETVEPIAVQEWDGEISACARDRDILEMLENLPSVQQKQTLAYWIGKELGECSNCGHNGCSSDIWNGCLQMFCPNCGAKMEDYENE